MINVMGITKKEISGIGNHIIKGAMTIMMIIPFSTARIKKKIALYLTKVNFM